MILNYVKVIDSENTNVIDCKFSFEDNQDSFNNHNTLILGENGVGKSFILRLVTDIFMNIDKARKQKRKPKFKYQGFTIDYWLDGRRYKVVRSSPRETKAWCDDLEIKLEEIKLPQKILAVSFMVNDKFYATEDNTYKYLGVRSSNNSTYTSSLAIKIYHNLLTALEKNQHDKISNILKMIDFEAEYFKCTIKREERKTIKIIKDGVSQEKVKIIRKSTDHKFIIDSDHRYNFSDYELKSDESLDDLVFVKNGKEVSFEVCSSGEKHILFAFSGVLSQIEDESLILIDEPEISLHPKWQIEYMSNLDKIFKDVKSCHFVLASHSHFFVSDLPPKASSLVVMDKEEDCFKSTIYSQETSAWSAEDIIYNVFKLRTTRNYYFERDIGELLSLMASDDMDIERMKMYIDKLKVYVLSDNDPLLEVIRDAEEYIKNV